jgi:hypothetical protein
MVSGILALDFLALLLWTCGDTAHHNRSMWGRRRLVHFVAAGKQREMKMRGWGSDIPFKDSSPKT